jgi:hypothetical protein
MKPIILSPQIYYSGKGGFYVSKKTVIALFLIFIICTDPVYAQSGDAAFWGLVRTTRKGLFWIGIFTSFYGLYLQMLKHDDNGKKIVVTSVLTYLASYVVPTIFISIDKTFK